MIRQIKIEDAQAVSRLITEELGYPMPADVIAKRIAELLKASEHYLYVFEEEASGVIGYVEAVKYDGLLTAVPWLNIMGLAVSADYTCKGVGQQLMRKIEELGEALGYEGIRLNSGEGRIGAHQFYQHIGYIGDKKQLRFRKMLKG